MRYQCFLSSYCNLLLRLLHRIFSHTFKMNLSSIVLVIVIFICKSDGQLIERPYVRTNLRLRIVVHYPESKLTALSLSRDLFIVGNGLGLAWDQPTRLTKSGTADTWTIDLKFSGSSGGYSCSNCTYNNVLSTNERLEYRILTSDMTDMVGPNFGLAINSASKLEANFPTREQQVFPYFFSRTGSVHYTKVTSSVNPVIGARNWSYYLPPSFNENPYKTYQTYLVPDLSAVYMEPFRLLLEDVLVDKAVAEEVVLIGSEDYYLSDQDGRMAFLTPTPGISYECINGNYSDNCAGCIPPNTSGRAYNEYMRDGCGYPRVVGGYGEGYIDHMVNEVLPVIRDLTSNRLRLSRDDLGIGGCSLGGLLSCHALWTRPDTFGMGWCKSSSFWWPTEANANNGFYFLNHTVKVTNLGPRAPQRIYVDVTDLEDDPYYAQLGAALGVVDTMIANSPQFRMDETIWFTLVNDQKHSSWNCLTRTWDSLSLLNPPAGAPKNPNPPKKI